MKKNIGSLIDKIKVGRGYSGFLICQICNKKFKATQVRINKGLGKYCSKLCYGKATKGKTRLGVGEKISKTKRTKGTYIDFKCEVCGKEIQFSPSHVKGRRTCSRECMGKLVSERLKKMWENPKDGLIDKLRAAAVKRRRLGRADKETKPEKAFREELESRHIIFEPQFRFGGMMIVDFFIPSLQAFIFCDGIYWHSLPSSQEKDWQQVEYARSKGMKVYRFTDKEVYKNVKKCVDFVLEDAEQVFSFAEVVDKLTVLAIKTQMTTGDKLKQVLKDYRRVEMVVIAGLEHHYVKEPKKVLHLLKELISTNIKVFMLVDKVQKNDFEKAEAIKVQALNKHRSDLMNALNREFKEREIIKI